jgi:DNA-binding transcriptional LysR family regulator
MTWPSAVATTTLPLATAGEDVTSEAASYSQTLLPLARSKPVDAAVVGADEYAAAGDRRRRTVRVSPDLRPAIIGAPAYFESHAKPASPRDLLQHRCIRFRHRGENVNKWELDKGNQSLEIAVNGSLILDELDRVIQAAIDGAGLAWVAEDRVAAHLSSGTLVRVLEDWCPPFPGFFLYFPSRKQPPGPLAALIDTLRLEGNQRK